MKITKNAAEKKKNAMNPNQTQLFYDLASIYHDVLQRTAPAGCFTESELAHMAWLRNEFSTTLTDEDYQGSDPEFIFENPAPVGNQWDFQRPVAEGFQKADTNKDGNSTVPATDRSIRARPSVGINSGTPSGGTG